MALIDCIEEGKEDEDILNLYNLYDVFDCISARESIKRILKEHPQLKEKYGWVIRELGIETKRKYIQQKFPFN